VVRGNRRDFLIIGLALARDRHVIDRFDRSFGSRVDAPLQCDRVRTRCDVLEPLAKDRVGEHGGARRAVTGFVGDHLGDLRDHLGTHRLERLGQLDFLSDGHAVLGQYRAAERFLDRDVPTARAHRAANRFGQPFSATLHLDQRRIVEHDLLLCHCVSSSSFAAGFETRSHLRVCVSVIQFNQRSRMPSSSVSRRIRWVSPLSSTSVPAYLL